MLRPSHELSSLLVEVALHTDGRMSHSHAMCSLSKSLSSLVARLCVQLRYSLLVPLPELRVRLVDQAVYLTHNMLGTPRRYLIAAWPCHGHALFYVPPRKVLGILGVVGLLRAGRCQRALFCTIPPLYVAQQP